VQYSLDNLIPETYLQRVASKEIQSRYLQFCPQDVEKLLIKFFIKEDYLVDAEVKYVIVKDVDNKIEYQEVYDKEVDRTVVAAQRERLEEFKKQRADLDQKIAEIEAELVIAEKIIAIADEKKAEEARIEAEKVEAEKVEAAAVEPVKEEIVINV
jgi:hypothetical protein